MCQQLIEKIKHRCGCGIDAPGRIMEYNGCNNCGVIQKTQYLGQTTKENHALIVSAAVLG